MPERIALVTGASRGIGRAVAEALALGGHMVAVNHRDSAQGAKETLELVHAAGAEGVVVQGDVSRSDEVERMFAEVEDALGPPTTLVNNAGLRRDGLALRMSDQDWHAVMATNLFGTFACSRRALRSMLAARRGRIINIASIAAEHGNPGQANYCAAKAGVLGLTRALAAEVARKGVTVNAIAPGLIDTELVGDLSDEARERLVTAIPMKRPGTAQEAAALVAFLASDPAAYVNGSVFVVDGGMTA